MRETRRRSRWWLPPLLLALAGAPALAQQAPRPLFPAAPAPIPPAEPSAPPLPAPEPPARIEVQPLAPPAAAALGLASAQNELGGPLWTAGAMPELALLIQRLPSEITEPTLRELQKAFLAAPGPSEPGALELFLIRLDRLLAMAEPETALELLALVPDGREGPQVETRRLLARFAADQVEPACDAALRDTSAADPWPRARVLCAALSGDPSGVELGLDLLAARGEAGGADFAVLARALAEKRRANLRLPLPDDPLLLPLLRRVPLDLDPAAVPELPPAARAALLDNQSLASSVRAAAAPPRPGPSARPELNGTPPGDWAAAAAGVPPEKLGAWAALVDGQGLELPEAVWTEVYRAGASSGAASAPDLYLWRGFEVARSRNERGAMLLHILLLLDGRPEAAAPVTLRRALDGLDGLGLGRTARALAAGTGGALGLRAP